MQNAIIGINRPCNKTRSMLVKCYLVKHYYESDMPRRIGIFTTMEGAQGSIEELSTVQGFDRAPKRLKNKGEGSGFFVRELVIDELAFRIVTPKARIKKSQQVFLLEHQYTAPDANLHYQVIGVFSETKEAKHLAVKLKGRPEYGHAGELVEAHRYGNGFHIIPLSMDVVDWREGFDPV